MPILTPEELINYLPSLSLSPIEAEIVISKAQGIAESHHGANRNLEITEYVEEKEILSEGEFRLRNFPLDKDFNIVVEVKDFGLIAYGGLVPQDSGWRTLDPTNYTIDYNTQEIRITNSYLSGFYVNGINLNWGTPGTFRRGRNYPLHRQKSASVKVKYAAGWNFSDENPSLDIRKIKSALAGMIEILSSKQAQGVKSYTSDGDKIEYFSVAEQQQNVKYLDYLSIFCKYRPRDTF